MDEKIVCHNCGIELNKENTTKEHIPAQNLFDGLSEDYKKNRVTVPCCNDCNNLFSKIDQEIRDVIGIANDDMTKENVVTQKAVRSIMRKSNWRERSYIDEKGDVHAIDFSYDNLKEIHVKNFKGLFYKKYRIIVPENYRIEIIADGDDEYTRQAQIIHDLLRSEDEPWEVSGHEDVFKYIIRGIANDEINNRVIKTDNLDEANGVAALLVYHDNVGVIIIALKKEYLAAIKPIED